MRLLMFMFLGICFFNREAGAQAVDMRAYSRQRGFKAYSAPQQAYSAPKPAYVPSAVRPRAQNPVEPVTENAAEPQERKIRQTGVKVFQEKDEDKVLNFNVENPEFDKLSEYKKQNLMKRITFEKNTD